MGLPGAHLLSLTCFSMTRHFSGSDVSSDVCLLTPNSFTLPENLLAFVLLFQFSSPPFQFPFPLKSCPCHDTFPWGFSPDLILAVPKSHQLQYISFISVPIPVPIADGPATFTPVFFTILPLAHFPALF